MGTFATFERDLVVATKGLELDAINATLAKFARAELANAIASGEGTDNYGKFVNGRPGAQEESVKAPGPILYVFNWWEEILTAAIAELKKRSPRRTGRFAASFIVIAGGRPVTDYGAIRGDEEVLITNFQPYVRRIESTKRDGTVFLGAKQALGRRFGNSYRVETRFLNIGAGVHPMIPYVRKRGGRRADRTAGQAITYPALIINAL